MLDDSAVNRAIYKCLKNNPEGATGSQVRAQVARDYDVKLSKHYMPIRIKYLKDKGYIEGKNRKWFATPRFHIDAELWEHKNDGRP